MPAGYSDYREEPYVPPVLTAQELLLLEATMALLSRKGIKVIIYWFNRYLLSCFFKKILSIICYYFTRSPQVFTRIQ